MKKYDPYPLINGKYKFIIFTNSKCAGTTIKSWFIGSLNLDEALRNPFQSIKHLGLKFTTSWIRKAGRLHSRETIQNNNELLRWFTIRYRRTTHHLLGESLQSPDWTRIAVIRNPYDRVISGYIDKFCTDEKDRKFVQEVIQTIHNGSSGPVSFEQFLDYLETTDNDTVNRHWRRQSYILDDVTVDKFIDIKNLAAGFSELEEKFGINAEVNFKSKRQSNSYKKETDSNYYGSTDNEKLAAYREANGSFPPKSAFLTDENKRRISKIYKKDFDLFKGFYESA